MAITLTPDTTKRLHGSIKRFAAEHLDEEMGDLKANLLLDFVLKEIGPSIYKKLGIDPDQILYTPQGRPTHLVSDPTPIAELFA